jgi:cyanophycinase
MKKSLTGSLILISILISCTTAENKTENYLGSLFIIGGGKRPPSLVQNMIELSGVDSAGYIVILPMSSSEPDTSAFYGEKQFRELDISNITTIISGKNGVDRETEDLIANAAMIYITGGDQGRFMDSVKGTNVETAIWNAYKSGAMIAGTSAGAAVQSKLMITGDQKNQPIYDGYFPTIEADNMILAEGLGFIDKIIIDQHFIQRQRLNRLIAVILEHPDKTGVGIDESTAIHVRGDSVKVYGKSQVIVLKGNNQAPKIENGLLGGKNLALSVYLPGEGFLIE